ncbi:hypothetical protein [Sporosarcina sp. UB5]|uniref:hypothetical protein n=1 Tax=Sporosarcina sp. UB5 TaxID=3047463 RepID=UPI003D78F2E8
MGQTVRELLHDAIFYDEPLTAHAVYYALQKGLVQLDDPESKFRYEELDFEMVYKMRDENLLQMCTIKLFVVPMSGKRYAIYLARNEEDVRGKHHKIYGRLAQEIRDVSNKMDAAIYYEDTGESQCFRELKREAVHFPYYAGEMYG